MTLKHWLVGAAGALALGSLSASVQAAPLGVGPDGLKPADENKVLQDVVWVRRCWWHRGHRHCRRVWRDSGYYYDPYYYDPYFYGPSFSFRFGGHGHRHHGHHHRGGRHR
jgi:hypothetical protein